MDHNSLNIAAEIVASSSREATADKTIKRTLAQDTNLPPLERKAIARAVFCYYRWLGWLEPEVCLREPADDQAFDRTYSRRKLTGQIEDACRLQDRFNALPEGIPDNELAQKAVPSWLKAYMGVPPSWLRTLQSEPLIWIRAKLGRGRQLAAELGSCRIAGSGPLADTLEYFGDQDLFRCRAFHAGEFEIQDIASQLVGLLSPPQSGETWWDACAGEGGKTLHYSELMRNSGLIWATDRAAWRLAKLKRRAARARVFNYQSTTWDGGVMLPFRTRFDGVLVDSPCSGIGTWQRNPQARWTTSGNDIKELAQRQIDLLNHAAAAVKNGGKLVYAVCTLSRLETTGVAQGFADQNPGYTPLPLSLTDGHFSTQGAQHCWWPQTTRGNGMFVAVWKRNLS